MTEFDEAEYKILFNAIDVDMSGKIDYREFSRKLEKFGAINMSKEEDILYQLVKAVPKFGINLEQFFKFVDQEGRGVITTLEFRNLFEVCKLKVKDSDIDQFMEKFCDKPHAGMDYKKFFRLFT